MIIQKMSDGIYRVKTTDYDQVKYRSTRGGTPEAVEVQKEILIEFKKELKKLDQKVTQLSKSIQAKKLNTADVIYYLNQVKQLNRG